ncbi:MAG: hypothetical protein HN704_08015 [Bacteroidetes bacterium]|jgi:hypothetical protein|nr:hypothetical protein [Bacteroidota bacterium]MBT6684973.1 hypothetical protein [Bacteroidota bacterium]MBT7143051.1 hypothetical protein [Bacteroidota bacterium]MBT7491536.1 hypothetical protein [Bacteroidota bacterium]
MKTLNFQKIRANIIISIFVVIASLSAVLVPYSLLFGWNVISVIVFWFFLVPLVSIAAARFYFNEKKQYLVSIVGCFLFYMCMLFMIYEHYLSDFFVMMMISMITSLIVITLAEIFYLK